MSFLKSDSDEMLKSVFIIKMSLSCIVCERSRDSQFGHNTFISQPVGVTIFELLLDR